jgi:glyoxylase-like metal-dependent hydrolase (beta-lactamase superfamily II)
VREELERAGIAVFERGWLSSNNVLVRGDVHCGAAVVDTGYWSHSEQTIALVRSGLADAPLARIINTHLHSDHCGGNAALAASFGCDIDVPSGEADAVDTWDEKRLTYAATGQYCPRFQRTGVLVAPGEVAAGRWTWQEIASPGHDPRSVALYQPELEVLISADALWENGFGVVFPELEGQSAFDDVRSTLETFARLPVRCVIPGHGRPFDDMSGAIARAFKRLDELVRDPRRHALHAAKVLIKFRLLETQVESWPSLLDWLSKAEYFETVRRRYFFDVDLVCWARQLVEDLAHRGALRTNQNMVSNA